jgi:hypothetical protein
MSIESKVVFLGLSSTLRWVFIVAAVLLWGSVSTLPIDQEGVLPRGFTLFQVKIMLVALLVTQVYRKVEQTFGPRTVPDVKRDYRNLTYFLSQAIRKSRQLFEIIVYTLLPAFLWSKVLLHEDAEWEGPYRLPWFVCISFACGIIQLVFGVNPSHKASIYDQYIDAVNIPLSRNSSSSSSSSSHDSNSSYNISHKSSSNSSKNKNSSSKDCLR